MADESGKPVDDRPPDPDSTMEPAPVPPPSPTVRADNVTHDLEIALEFEVRKLVDHEQRQGASRREAYVRATRRLQHLLSLLGYR